MSNSNQSAKSGNMVSGEGTVENVVDLLLAQSTGEVSPLYEDNTINNQPAASGNFFNAEGEVENIVDVLLEKTSSEPLYEDKNNTLNIQPIKTGNMVASDGKVYNIVDLLKNAGGGSGGNIETFYKMTYAITAWTDDTHFTITALVDEPDLSQTEYAASFTYEVENGVAKIIGGGVTKDGESYGEAIPYCMASLYSGGVTSMAKLSDMTSTGERTMEFDFDEWVAKFELPTISSQDEQIEEGGLYRKSDETFQDGGIDLYWKIKVTPPAPIQKGSFDSTTQQLTLNYDYLVEMVNSSTVTTAEQKSAMIASLNNQSPVINMATDAATPNQYLYAFVPAEGTAPVGLQVDKATPCTLKLLFVVESIGGMGSYQAIANYMTELSGETTTPEMVEAQYAPFIVDENLCTVSGTLGNFSVEFN